MKDWPTAVREAIDRLVKTRSDRIVTRQDLVKYELQQIARDTNTLGATPEQTLSRILQDLRDRGELEFLGRGRYRSLRHNTLPPIHAELQDLSETDLTEAIASGRLRLGIVEASTAVALSRRRRGQDRIRSLTLLQYSARCALCDVDILALLVASHIVPWASDEEARGRLENVICLCNFTTACLKRDSGV